MAEFQFIVNGELVTYDKYEDIPETFDHVIKFLPDIPPEPHTEEEHEHIDSFMDKFREISKRGKKDNG